MQISFPMSYFRVGDNPGRAVVRSTYRRPIGRNSQRPGEIGPDYNKCESSSQSVPE